MSALRGPAVVVVACFVASWCACTQSTTAQSCFPVTFGGTGGGEALATEPAFFAGREVVTTLVAPVTECGLDRADVHVVTELVDPSGNREPVGVAALRYVPTEGSAAVTLNFTPTTPGSWFLTTTFEPSLGRTQSTLLVVADATSAPRVHEVVPFSEVQCASQWRTTHGAVLCQDALSSQVRVARNGQQIDLFAGAALAVAGDAVWTHSVARNRLERRHDSGSGALVLDGQVDVQGSSLTDRGGYSDETHALRFRGYEVLRFTWDGTSLARDTSEPQYIANAEYSLVLDEGRAWVVGRSLCPVDGRDECLLKGAPVALSVVGVEPTAFWLMGPGLIRVPRPLGASTVPTTVPMPSGWFAPLVTPIGGSMASFSSQLAGTVLPVLGNGTVSSTGADALVVGWKDDAPLFLGLRPATGLLLKPPLSNGGYVSLHGLEASTVDFIASETLAP